MNSYPTSSGITNITSVHDAPCGVYDEERMLVCARVIEEAVIMVMGFNDQSNGTLADLIESAYNTVRKQQQVFTVAQR